MKTEVQGLFERYEGFFLRALAGEADMAELEELYTPDYIAASPAGVMSGKIDARFRQTLLEGYEHYRAIGTRQMQVRHIDISPMGDSHCVAHVAWIATYARPNRPDAKIDFEVHYLVRLEGGMARVFGWVTGDEQAVLRRHGII